MHIGEKTSETTWGESKTEFLYIPPATELKQLLDMGLSKDDIQLLANDIPEDDVISEDNVLLLDDKNEEKQPETQRMRRRKPKEQIYEYSNETLPVYVDGGRITHCMHFKYLGSWISFTLSDDKDIENAYSGAHQIYWRPKKLFQVRLQSKAMVFMALPINFLLWGCELWAVCKYHLNILQSAINLQIQRILKLTIWDVKDQQITNKQLS
jgi:hypothetical protein